MPAKNKERNYSLIVKGYRKFWGTKKIAWFDPPKGNWVRGDLQVSVNPELGLLINGKKHVVKLYFKAEKLSKLRVRTILRLIQKRVGADDVRVALLDVRNSKLYVGDAGDKPDDVDLLLNAEADAFATIYAGLK